MTSVTGLSSCSNDDDDNPETELPPYMEEKVPVIVGSQTFTLSVFDTPAGRAFKALLPLTISMEDVNSNEKFYRLPQGLPQSAANPGTIRTGDLNLYGSAWSFSIRLFRLRTAIHASERLIILPPFNRQLVPAL